MSRRVKSTYRPKGRSFGRGYPQAVFEVDEPEQEPPTERKNITPEEEPPTERKNITPGEERKDEGASEFPGASLEAAQQELAEPKTGSEHGDDHDVQGKELPNPEPMKVPEVGEGKPQI